MSIWVVGFSACAFVRGFGHAGVCCRGLHRNSVFVGVVMVFMAGVVLGCFGVHGFGVSDGFVCLDVGWCFGWWDCLACVGRSSLGCGCWILCFVFVLCWWLGL